MQPDLASRWRHLGELLVQRRIQLSPRYRERTVFARETGLDWRLLHDIERAKRTRFKAETLSAIEVAYKWQPGSIWRVLDGGEPVLAEGSPRAADSKPWGSGYTPEERALADALIQAVRDARRNIENGGDRERSA